MSTAVLLASHGTVDSLDELPAFLANIRRGQPVAPALLREVRRRYEAIGGRSPLNDINREVARRLAQRLGLPTRAASRLWRPATADVLRELVSLGCRRIVVVPLAQHSARVYAEAARAAARDVGAPLELVCADNWGTTPKLLAAFAERIEATLERVGRDAWRATCLLMTAHSLPLAVVRAGDPYEREVRASAAGIAARLADGAPAHRVVFQSQGMGTGPGGAPVEWLGPDVASALDAAAVEGNEHVVIAPIGFLADHVEILYDLDIEARHWARDRGLTLHRTGSLNASDALVDALVEVVRPLLGERVA